MSLLPYFISLSTETLEIIAKPQMSDVAAYKLAISAYDGYYAVTKNFTLVVAGRGPYLPSSLGYENVLLSIGAEFEISLQNIFVDPDKDALLLSATLCAAGGHSIRKLDLSDYWIKFDGSTNKIKGQLTMKTIQQNKINFTNATVSVSASFIVLVEAADPTGNRANASFWLYFKNRQPEVQPPTIQSSFNLKLKKLGALKKFEY